MNSREKIFESVTTQNYQYGVSGLKFNARPSDGTDLKKATGAKPTTTTAASSSSSSSAPVPMDVDTIVIPKDNMSEEPDAKRHKPSEGIPDVLLDSPIEDLQDEDLGTEDQEWRNFLLGGNDDDDSDSGSEFVLRQVSDDEEEED